MSFRIRFFVPSFGKSLCFQSIATEHLSEHFLGLRTQFFRLFGFVGGTLGFPNASISRFGAWRQIVNHEQNKCTFCSSRRGQWRKRNGSALTFLDDQDLTGLYDLPALLLRLRPALPHPADMWSSTSPGPTRRAPHKEVPQLDGPQGSGDGLVS